jgi:hypothetical protein
MVFRAVIPNLFRDLFRKDEMLNQACAEFISVSSMTTKPFADFIPWLS